MSRRYGAQDSDGEASARFPHFCGRMGAAPCSALPDRGAAYCGPGLGRCCKYNQPNRLAVFDSRACAEARNVIPSKIERVIVIRSKTIGARRSEDDDKAS